MTRKTKHKFVNKFELKKNVNTFELRNRIFQNERGTCGVVRVEGSSFFLPISMLILIKTNIARYEEDISNIPTMRQLPTLNCVHPMYKHLK